MNRLTILLALMMCLLWTSGTNAENTDASQSRESSVEQSPHQSDAKEKKESRKHQRGRRDRKGFGRNHFENLSEQEQKEKVLTFIKEHFPEAASALEKIEKTNPRLHERKLKRIMHEMMRLAWSKEHDPPEVFELRISEYRLELQIRQLTREYHSRSTEPQRKEEIHQNLEQAVAELFEIRQQRARLEIKQLEQKIGKLRNQIENQEQRRDEIIKRQVDMRIKRGGKHRDRGPKPEGESHQKKGGKRRHSKVDSSS